MNYAGMMGAFCERLGWADYSALFLRISDKINWQVKEDLLELMQISSLRPERARALFVAGYTTVQEVAAITDVSSLVDLFLKSEGFTAERASRHLPRRVGKQLLGRFHSFAFPWKTGQSLDALRNRWPKWVRAAFDEERPA